MAVVTTKARRRNKPATGARVDPGHPLAAGLVGCWVLDEGSGPSAHDLSGYAQAGTLVGTASWGGSGYNIGTGLLVNGGTGNGVNVPLGGSNPCLLTGPFTLAALVQTTSNAAQQGILEKYDAAGNGYVLRLTSAGKVQGYTLTATTSASVTGATTVAANLAIWIAAAFDGATLRVYYQGAQDGAVAAPAPTATTTHPLRIGQRGDDQGLCFQGVIALAAIWVRALGQAELFGLVQDPYGWFAPPNARRFGAILWTSGSLAAAAGSAGTGLAATGTLPGTLAAASGSAGTGLAATGTLPGTLAAAAGPGATGLAATGTLPASLGAAAGPGATALAGTATLLATLAAGAGPGAGGLGAAWTLALTLTAAAGPGATALAGTVPLPADLMEAIVQALGANAALATAFGHRDWLWADAAPRATRFPYAILAEVTETAAYQAAAGDGSTPYDDDARYQLVVYAADQDQARALASQVLATLTDAPLAFTRGVLLQLRRARRWTAKDPERGPNNGDVWQRGLVFEALTARTL